MKNSKYPYALEYLWNTNWSKFRYDIENPIKEYDSDTIRNDLIFIKNFNKKYGKHHYFLIKHYSLYLMTGWMGKTIYEKNAHVATQDEIFGILYKTQNTSSYNNIEIEISSIDNYMEYIKKMKLQKKGFKNKAKLFISYLQKLITTMKNKTLTINSKEAIKFIIKRYKKNVN